MNNKNFALRMGSRLGVLMLLALPWGCTVFQDVATRLPGPRLYEKGAEVIGGVREFAYRIGFKETDNFTDLDTETESFPFCGSVSTLYLPYSYEDPAIRWKDASTEADCRALAGPGMDAYFGQTEAVGEQGMPVNMGMLAGTLVRFIYLVFHEDCHDQYDLPYGIEEPLCNVISYHAMAAYADEKDRFTALQRVALRRYAVRESDRTRQAKAFYEQLEAAHARYARKEITEQALMGERAAIFGRAERALAWERGSLNNVGIANDMTYSRHFPYLEEVHIALGRDLARTVEFFRRVDARKPNKAALLKQRKLKTEDLQFVRDYEAMVIATIEKLLAEEGRAMAAPSRKSEVERRK
jgi:hypothetical protein